MLSELEGHGGRERQRDRETDTEEAGELGSMVIRDRCRLDGMEMGTRDQDDGGRRTNS